MSGNLLLLVLLIFGLPYLHQGLDTPRSDSPQSGQACSGVITISGNTDVSGFRDAEFHFAFADSQEWLFIGKSDTPVSNGPLITWETTKIVDETYDIRVRVFLNDGTLRETIVHKIFVNNDNQYTIAAQSSESNEITNATSESSHTEALIFNTPTSMPQNSTQLKAADVTRAIIYGSGMCLICLIVFFIFRKGKGK